MKNTTYKHLLIALVAVSLVGSACPMKKKEIVEEEIIEKGHVHTPIQRQQAEAESANKMCAKIIIYLKNKLKDKALSNEDRESLTKDLAALEGPSEKDLGMLHKYVKDNGIDLNAIKATEPEDVEATRSFRLPCPWNCTIL